MPFLKKAVLIPIQGLDYSAPPTLIEDRNAFAKNMRIKQGELTKRAGHSKLGSVPTDSQIMGLGAMELPSGEKIILRASKKKMAKFNGTTEEWDDITGFASDFTGGDDDFFSFTNPSENSIILMTNYKDAIRKYSSTGSTALLGGNPPLAKFCAYISPYVLLGYTDDGTGVKPWGVSWCDTGEPEIWSTGNAGSLLLANDSSAIKNLVNLDRYMCVYKEKSIWLLRKVETSDIFMKDCVAADVGLLSSRGVVAVGGIHYFIGEYDIYQFNGAHIESIGASVKEHLFGMLDRHYKDRCFASHMDQYNEVWFFIVRSGNTWPKDVFKYNYGNGYWYHDTCDEFTASIAHKTSSSITWDEMTGTWKQQTLSWDETLFSSDAKIYLMGKSDGYVVKVDETNLNDCDTAIDSWFVSKDFVSSTLHENKRWLQLDIWASGGSVNIEYSIDSGSVWKSVKTVQLTTVIAKYQIYFDVVSDKIRFRFRNNVKNQTFTLQNFYAYYLNREEIR